MELLRLGGPRQGGGGAALLDHLLGQEVKVTRANKRLVLDGGVAQLLGREFRLLEVSVRGHAAGGVFLGQGEHREVEGVEAGEGDELELVAWGGGEGGRGDQRW